MTDQNRPTEETALVAKQKFNEVRQLLEQSKVALTMALPKFIAADYMIRVALTSVQRTPELLECHPITLVGALFQAAQLGLVPDGVLGHAYLVPYRNRKKNRKEVQFIPGYKGLVALARRSGEVSTVGAEVVREKDHFKYALGLTPILEHVPTEDEKPGNIKYVYAFARLKDGGYQLVVLNVRQVNAIKARSQAASSEYSPWTTDPEWMFKKTAIRQLCKLLPASIELQSAVALDERAEIGLPQDLSLLAGDPSETPTPEDTIEQETTTAAPRTLPPQPPADTAAPAPSSTSTAPAPAPPAPAAASQPAAGAVPALQPGEETVVARVISLTPKGDRLAVGLSSSHILHTVDPEVKRAAEAAKAVDADFLFVFKRGTPGKTADKLTGVRNPA